MPAIRIGQIVPSSNTTMETEIPALLRAREAFRPERFTFHSSRMRMKSVTPEALAAMDAQSHRCAEELADARVDIIGYACLVAIMATGPGYHRPSEAGLKDTAARQGCPCPVVTSAGALVDGLSFLKARRITLLAPYMKPLTARVIAYLENEGIEVVDSLSLEVEDNLAVGRLDPKDLIGHARRLNTSSADAVVLSACVQMPSLPALMEAEAALGRPVTSSAACTVAMMLHQLGLERFAPGGGAVLAL